MEKVRTWCSQPSDRGRLKNRTEELKDGKRPLRGVWWSGWHDPFFNFNDCNHTSGTAEARVAKLYTGRICQALGWEITPNWCQSHVTRFLKFCTRIISLD